MVMVDSQYLARIQDHRRSRHLRPVSIAVPADEGEEWLKANGNMMRVVSLPASWTSLPARTLEFQSTVVPL